MAAEVGQLWGTHAQDWAEEQEGMHRPLYVAVFDRLQIGPGTRLLDDGCGAGLAAKMAAERGATVAGIDASEAMIEIARGRVPQGDFRVGDMQSLPFEDAAFDAVTGFNSIQYADDPVAAFREAARVTRPGGHVAVCIFGAPEQVDHAATLRAVMSFFLPPGDEGPLALYTPGALENLMEQAGIRLIDSGEVDCPFEWSDDETAWQALHSPGPMVAASASVGEETLRTAVLASLQPFKQPSGSYRQENVFRYVIGQV